MSTSEEDGQSRHNFTNQEMQCVIQQMNAKCWIRQSLVHLSIPLYHLVFIHYILSYFSFSMYLSRYHNFLMELSLFPNHKKIVFVSWTWPSLNQALTVTQKHIQIIIIVCFISPLVGAHLYLSSSCYCRAPANHLIQSPACQMLLVRPCLHSGTPFAALIRFCLPLVTLCLFFDICMSTTESENWSLDLISYIALVASIPLQSDRNLKTKTFMKFSRNIINIL